MLTNPCAWSDFPSYGGSGWVGADGSRQAEWLGLVAPFLFGSMAVMILDSLIGLQFLSFPNDEVLGHDAATVDSSDSWTHKNGAKAQWWIRKLLGKKPPNKSGAEEERLLHDATASDSN